MNVFLFDCIFIADLLDHLGCPRGHTYAIGNVGIYFQLFLPSFEFLYALQCGRPRVRGKCPECGGVIGGEGYKSADGNKAVSA